jgi:hypothetical protein
VLLHRQFDVMLLVSGARKLHEPPVTRLINDGVGDEAVGTLSGQNTLKVFSLLHQVYPPR